MNGLRYRIAFYLVGLIIGIYVVKGFWKVKGTEFCYLPNCRVIKDIRSKSFHISKEATAFLNENKISQEKLDTLIKNGDIDFDKSNIKVNGGKKYIIETNLNQSTPIYLELINYSNKVDLVKVSK